MSRKPPIYIIAEHHPSNLEHLSLIELGIIEKDIENLGEELIKSLYEGKDAFNIIKRLVKNIIDIDRLVDMFFYAQEIKEREIKILNELISKIGRNGTIFLEGNEEANMLGRSDILEFAKVHNLKVEYLDRGNVRYERLTDENGRLLKSGNEIQKGREDFWIRRIEECIEGMHYAIAIVGINHVQNIPEDRYSSFAILRKDIKSFCRDYHPKYKRIVKLYEKFRERSYDIGKFDKKLRERGYKVEVFEVVG